MPSIQASHPLHTRATLRLPMSTGMRPLTGEALPAASALGAADRELVERIRRGDRAAEGVLYRQHVGALMGLATRLLGRTADAEDVVHDAFVTAFESLDRVRDATALRAWLVKVTIRHAHRRFRRRRLLQRLGFDAAPDDASLAQLAAPGCSVEVQAELSRLDRALAELPAKLRTPWLLRHVEGLELVDVANACEVSLATVKRRIAAAQARVDQHTAGVPTQGARHA
jgi:RNA polymerase sigma-70 factor (ECF subfamily)